MPRDLASAFRRHAQRCTPFYVFGAIGLVTVMLLPTSPPASDNRLGAGSFGDGLSATGPDRPGGASGGTLAGGEAGFSAPDSGRSAGGSVSDNPGDPTGPATVGITRGGFECRPGVRQLPWSEYAAPCRAAFTGENGGQTWQGVTGDAITVVLRRYAANPDTNSVAAIASSGGVASSEEQRRTLQVYLDYFNKTYELYGRRVRLVEFTSSANPFDEANGRGREQACADATRIAEELKAFAVIPDSGLGFGPFSECAAERGLLVPIGPYGFPEQWYERYHPFAYDVQMSCNRIAHLFVEYISKRLKGQDAVHARDPKYQRQARRFGAIRPDIEAYFPCLELSERLLAEAGIEIVSKYSYVLDPSRLSVQMNQAAIQFKADGVTTLLAGADFLTMIELTRAADNQGWGPEWILQGSGRQDADNYARLYNQSAVDGHMFGMSQLGDTAAILGPDGEPAETYRKATGAEKHPGALGDYFSLVHVFNLLQGAGPNLTPTTVAQGVTRLPPSGSVRAGFGRWSFATRPDGRRGFEHTAVDDSREVYWDRRATSRSGQQGTFVATLGGRRFTNGEWPAQAPPVYPDR